MIIALKNKTHDIEKASVAQRASPLQHAPAVKDHERLMNPVMALRLATSAHPSALRPADVLTLQGAIGNRAVQRMLSSRAHSLSRPSATPANAIQRQSEEEELLRGELEAAPGKETIRENRTGMPDGLKSGVESLSGISMDNVKVHYNSAQPAQLDALAYTRGSDIHVAPGQERHLPHEAWHVVQQAQGRVQPTMQLTDGVPVNDDQGLEHEADVMGERALAPTAQLKGRPEDEELLQGKFAPVQRKRRPEEKELLQGEFAPAQLNALAYTQGQHSEVGLGQERHMRDEGRHVVRQMQGRATRTMRAKEVSIQDDWALEREADVMGTKPLRMTRSDEVATNSTSWRSTLFQRRREATSSFHTPQSSPAHYQAQMPGGMGSGIAPVQRFLSEDGRNPLALSSRLKALIETNPMAVLYTYQALDVAGRIMSLKDQLNEVGAGEAFNRAASEVHKHLTSMDPIAPNWLADNVIRSLALELGRVNDAQMRDDGHDEDEHEAIEEPLWLEDVNASYWPTVVGGRQFLLDLFRQLEVVKQAPERIHEALFNWWLQQGVVTREGMTREALRLAQIQPVQKARGPGDSGPKSYATSTVGPYVVVTYTRDDDGYFGFGAPTAQTAWANPTSGAIVDMEAGCSKKGYGIMMDNKTKVPLMTASRSQHFSIANRISGNTGSSGSGSSPANYTWHHLKAKYKMILVDRQVHRLHGHNGGVYLWS